MTTLEIRENLIENINRSMAQHEKEVVVDNYFFFFFLPEFFSKFMSLCFLHVISFVFIKL